MRQKQYIIAAIAALAGVALIVALVLIGRRPPGREPGHRASAGVADTMPIEGVPDEVRTFLRNGQSWRAARAMRSVVAEGDDSDVGPDAILVAVRAEAGWGGWSRVRNYLEGEEWLDSVRGGEGWYWLARSLEEAEEWDPALAAYSRYRQQSDTAGAGDRLRVAELRQGLILLRQGKAAEGAALLQATDRHAPEIAPRIQILAAEALAEAGDTAGVRVRTEGATGSELARRARVTRIEAHQESGDTRGAFVLARGFYNALPAGGERAGLGVRSARLALQLGDSSFARAVLRQVIATSPGASSARAAAELLSDFPAPPVGELLRLAQVMDRHGGNVDAARYYRTWLDLSEAGSAQKQPIRLALGRALFDAGSHAAAITALAPITSVSGSTGAAAMLLTGRAETRLDRASRARATFLALADRHPGSEEGAEGLFLLADLAHDNGDRSTARTLYRRVADRFRGTDRAGLSLMRLGGIAFAAGDMNAAGAAWEQYRADYPAGERWLESTYWAGRVRERLGDASGAAERFRAVRERQPISYYAVQAAARLKEDYWPVKLAPDPPADSAAASQAAEWMHGVDLLREAGLHQEAEAEIERVIELAGDDTALLYPLAETLNERGYTVPGIQLGQRLRDAVETPSERLLKILYPFPYRRMIEAEAREKELDPFLVAALIRQESSFKARIASPVGARGLMQVMPQTAMGLASGAGVSPWDVELLYQPEINTHLGTRFLASQMRAFRSSLPSVFAAYNAGPNRVARWRRFPEYRDEELFTERIPYRETRDYVKILTRNIALYRALYSD